MVAPLLLLLLLFPLLLILLILRLQVIKSACLGSKAAYVSVMRALQLCSRATTYAAALHLDHGGGVPLYRTESAARTVLQDRAPFVFSCFVVTTSFGFVPNVRPLFKAVVTCAALI